MIDLLCTNSVLQTYSFLVVILSLRLRPTTSEDEEEALTNFG